MKYIIILVMALFFYACSSDNSIETINVDTADLISDTKLLKSKKDIHKKTYTIGFDLRNEPQEDVAQYLSLIKYLHTKTNLDFKLHITSKKSSTQKDLCSHTTDISIVGSLAFLQAHALCDAKILVRGLGHNNEATYRSMFITKPDSKINSIADLRNKKVAFGNLNSTQGYLIPRKELEDNKLTLQDFKAYINTNSHQECAEAVISGNYDVCTLQDTLAMKLEAASLVKIIHKSTPYPSSLIAVNKDIPPHVVQKIQTALLELQPKGAHQSELYHWDITEMPNGFIKGTFSDFSLLRSIASELGLLVSHEENR